MLACYWFTLHACYAIPPVALSFPLERRELTAEQVSCFLVHGNDLSEKKIFVEAKFKRLASQ